MTNSIRTGLLLLSLAPGLAGCSPTAPTPLAVTPAPPERPTVSPTRMPMQVQGSTRDSMSRPLEGVFVQAYGGPEGYATSDSNGEFTMTDVGPLSLVWVGTDTFHASKPGYVSETRTLESGLNFVLRPVEDQAMGASRR